VEVSGNVALVTGAASGLGEATARRLHAHGASIVLADLSEARGEAIARELGSNTLFVRCDVTSEADVSAAVAAGAELGRLSMSVHCAGGGIAARTVGRDGTPHAPRRVPADDRAQPGRHVQRAAACRRADGDQRGRRRR
jgi:NAD(P)-dependent dehydrogenase (short-subunit alcohol dehydrogenase family)